MKLFFYEIWIICTLKLIIVWDMYHFPFEIDYCMRYESFSIWNWFFIRYKSFSLWNWILYEIWIIFHLKWLFNEICIIFNLKLIIVWDMNHFHFEIDYFMRYKLFALSIVVSLYSEFRNGWHSRIKHFSSWLSNDIFHILE